jgi:tRNA(fMet)-specific endonuclease VapC
MYLLDTDTLIFFLKGNEQVTQNFRETSGQPKAISAISYGELVYGAYKSARPQENLAKVRRLAELYPLIDISSAIMESFGGIKAELSSQGITVDDFDLLIGCTALTCNYTVVTNNTKHFNKIPGLKLENWAERS